MNRIHIGLEKAYKGWQISAYQYDASGKLQFSYPSDQSFIAKDTRDALRKFSEEKKSPVVMFCPDERFHMAFLDSCENIYVLGPVDILQIKFPVSCAISCLSTVCLLVTGQYFSEETLTANTIRNNALQDEEILNYSFARNEDEDGYYQYRDEIEMLEKLEKGELEFHIDASRLPVNELFRVGLMAEDYGMKQTEYMVVTALALASRAAIRGGVPPYKAYQINGIYDQKLTKSQNMLDMLQLYMDGINELNKLVRERRKKQNFGNYTERCKDYISQHIKMKITVEKIADALEISPSYLARVFKEEEGISVKKYLLTERLKISCNLLRNSDASIAEISDYLNFHSQSYYTEKFKQQYAMTPTQYRKQYKRF